ncbi:MAG TPA: sigma 54-interacting transcriptional regulator, partial [Planctomycetota bacterium]|nr:sigma 54-interacting transcriptional regulator [Planctomycetota bacterium]
VEVNAAALTPSLIESELFGHVKGAFTGALGDRPGIFERARGGTVFLDEIGDAPPETQVKLLKVLQDKVVARIGDLEPRSVDFRLVSATNKPLQKLIKSEKFREDLYYRLNGCVIEPPPLRKREGDIRTLAMHFADEQAKKLGLPFMGIAPAAVAYLEKQRWPGNVRELQNVAANAFIQAQGLILREHLRVAEPEKKEPPTPERVVEALRESGGDITLAMEKIGSNRNWYYRHEDAIKALQKGV